MARAGVQSELQVESSPTVPGGVGRFGQPHTWTWVWFFIAVFVIIGFHVRVFGRAVPPAAHFP